MAPRDIDVIIIKRVDDTTITCELRTIKDDLKEFYSIIDCRAIDIVKRVFGGVVFDIVLDDEGLLKANTTNEWPTSWWQGEGYTPNHEGLFGTLILCHCDDQGNLTSAEPLDLVAVQSCFRTLKKHDGSELSLMFHDIEL